MLPSWGTKIATEKAVNTALLEQRTALLATGEMPLPTSVPDDANATGLTDAINSTAELPVACAAPGTDQLPTPSNTRPPAEEQSSRSCAESLANQEAVLSSVAVAKTDQPAVFNAVISANKHSTSSAPDRPGRTNGRNDQHHRERSSSPFSDSGRSCRSRDYDDRRSNVTVTTYADPGRSPGGTGVHFDLATLPLDEEAETFIVPGAHYPSRINGTWGHELRDAVRTPVTTAKRVLKSFKRRAEDAPSALPKAKRALKSIAEAMSDGASAYVNDIMKPYDVPEIAGRLMDPFLNVQVPSSAQVSKCVDNVTDAFQGSVKRPVHRVISADFKNMKDARHMFADVKGKKALAALVEQGILHHWEVTTNRANCKWRSQMENALTKFFLKNSQEVLIKDLMEANVYWIANKKDACYTLCVELGISEQRVNNGNGPEIMMNEETEFRLPDAGCRISAADYDA